MSANDFLGIIFANVHDNFIPDLTKKRSMASLPFGSRYRLIDFHLSNLVNAGISKVGIITNNNYHSLMDHVGTGSSWDLDRKRGGLIMLPPYSTFETGVYTSHIDALSGITGFLHDSNEEFVILCDADVVGNFDLTAATEKHIERGADVTVLYTHGLLPKNNSDIMILDTDTDERVRKISFSQSPESADYSLDVMIIRRELLMKLVLSAKEKGFTTLGRELLMPAVDTLRIYGHRINDFVCVIDSEHSYVRANMQLLSAETRRDLFNPEHPVYTKTRDDMPTRYGINADVSNCLIADGCIIKGTVKNCIIFRGVTVDEGSIVENCILMQDTQIGKVCTLNCILADKRVRISDHTSLCGTADKYVFLEKEKTV